MIPTSSIQRLGRRAFLYNGTLFLSASAIGAESLLPIDDKPRVRLGLVTDLHYAAKDSAGSRHYRDTPRKLEEAAKQFMKDQPSHVVELGDFIDAAPSVKDELEYLKRINKQFAQLPGKKHYVLGNHCVHTLTKSEFQGEVGQPRSYYSFDEGGFHFVILDACFRSDGKPYERKNFQWTDPNIPAEQLDWLAADLKKSEGKSIVFVHQRLDVENSYGIRNAAAVRKILEDSGKVLAVFQGHSHKNDLTEVNGIQYCVCRAMVEGAGLKNNGYSTVDVMADGSIQLQGFRLQQAYTWPA